MVCHSLRAAIACKHAERGVSEGKIYTATINYGTSIIKKCYGDNIQEMEGVRYKLLKSDNDIIKSLVGDFQICVNGVQGDKDRRTIRVPAWCKDYLGTVGAALRMEFSSMVRLALYLAFKRSSNLTEKEMVGCSGVIELFENKFRDYSTVCLALADTEEKKPMCTITHAIDEIWDPSDADAAIEASRTEETLEDRRWQPNKNTPR